MRTTWGIRLSILAFGLAGAPGALAQDACKTIDASNADDCLRINHIQSLGTHNSYHIEPTEALQDTLLAIRPDWGDSWRYTHRPLREQLGTLNIRQIELDVFADPQGGHYLQPLGQQLTGDPPQPDEGSMSAPGYKVFHVQDLDYRTTCPTLVGCLEEVRDWSLANPSHIPVMILVEVKDSPLRDTLEYRFNRPVAVGTEELDALDAEILSVFDRDHLITPDQVRRDHESLETAIQEVGWPTLAEARGKILLALDNTNTVRDDYLRDHPDLHDRAMFTSSPPGERTGGFIKMNEAIDDQELIRSYVEQGYLVRTRSDIPLHEARTADSTRRTAALDSGAQWVSTDYPEESPFGSGYIVQLPGAENQSARCNPVSAPPGCRNEWIID